MVPFWLSASVPDEYGGWHQAHECRVRAHLLVTFMSYDLLYQYKSQFSE
jgi:hypothetical protein